VPAQRTKPTANGAHERKKAAQQKMSFSSFLLRKVAPLDRGTVCHTVVAKRQFCKSYPLQAIRFHFIG
jgi:hypothetical protein